MVDVLIDEFKRKLRESSHLLGNPSLKRCRVFVELDPSRRVPISRQTRFVPFPKVLSCRYDPELLKLRNNEVIKYLQDGREQIVGAYESGANGYRLSMHDVTNIHGQTRPSVLLRYRDASGKWVSLGLE
jgi:hypothetical protein